MKIPAFLKDKQVQGWIIWFSISALLVGPCILGVYKITYDTASTLTRIIVGIFAAAILSGLLTSLGSEVWYRIQSRKYEERKKMARKEKRKKK